MYIWTFENDAIIDVISNEQLVSKIVHHVIRVGKVIPITILVSDSPFTIQQTHHIGIDKHHRHYTYHQSFVMEDATVTYTTDKVSVDPFIQFISNAEWTIGMKVYHANIESMFRVSQTQMQIRLIGVDVPLRLSKPKKLLDEWFGPLGYTK